MPIVEFTARGTSDRDIKINFGQEQERVSVSVYKIGDFYYMSDNAPVMGTIVSCSPYQTSWDLLPYILAKTWNSDEHVMLYIDTISLLTCY